MACEQPPLLTAAKLTVLLAGILATHMLDRFVPFATAFALS